jgi:hypothetical protein
LHLFRRLRRLDRPRREDDDALGLGRRHPSTLLPGFHA